LARRLEEASLSGALELQRGSFKVAWNNGQAFEHNKEIFS
jgi:hypothetical protein